MKNMRNRLIFVLVNVFIVSFVIYAVSTSLFDEIFIIRWHNPPGPEDDEESSVTLDEGTEKDYKLVLIYTSLFQQTPWNVIPYDYKFTERDGSQCDVDRCRVTYNKADLVNADAVLAYGTSYDLFHKHPVETVRSDQEKAGNDKQIWIYFNHESPANHDATAYGTLFNWVASYRVDSDIFIPYFDLIRSTDGPQITYDTVKAKSRQVLAIISNCWEVRLDFIRHLQSEGVQVDVYGECSHHFGEPKKCNRGDPSCLELQKTYKFYLAFENSFCEGYVTEKYYDHGLLKGLVPIVVAAANFNDDRIAAPGSFVNVRDFRDMKELAAHLKYLDSDVDAYYKYFEWRKTYAVIQTHYMCKFCKALWEKQDEPAKTVDLEKFWSKKSSCNYDHSNWEAVFKM